MAGRFPRMEHLPMEALGAIDGLAQVVRQGRKERGLTQMELARACGIGITTITNIESSNPTTPLWHVLIVLLQLGLIDRASFLHLRKTPHPD